MSKKKEISTKKKIIYIKTDIDTIYYRVFQKTGKTKYYVRLSHDGIKYPQVNYTDLFNNCDNLDDVNEKRKYIIMTLNHTGEYLVKTEQDKKNSKKIKSVAIKESLKIEEDTITKNLFNTRFWFWFNNSPKVKKLGKVTRELKELHYNKHIKPLIGSYDILLIDETDLQPIFDKMASDGLVKETQIKIKVLLNQVFEPLSHKRIIKYNPVQYTELIDPDNLEDFKPLDERLSLKSFDDYINLSRKVYQAIPKVVPNPQAQLYFYLTLMSARRKTELYEITQADIKGNIVTSKEEITKTKILEEWLLPQEALDLIDPKNKNPFKLGDSTVYRNWKKICDSLGIDKKDFRNRDGRNLLMSIMTLKNDYFTEYDEIVVGATISHHGGDRVSSNKTYRSIPLESRSEVFETYWKLLREDISTIVK